MVFVIGETKAFAGEVASKNTHACVQVFSKFRKFEMELQRSPEALPGFLFGFGANQEIELIAVAGEQTRVLAFEDMFVVKNKWLVEFDQFFGADQVSFGAGERRFLHT